MKTLFITFMTTMVSLIFNKNDNFLNFEEDNFGIIEADIMPTVQDDNYNFLEIK